MLLNARPSRMRAKRGSVLFLGGGETRRGEARWRAVHAPSTAFNCESILSVSPTHTPPSTDSTCSTHRPHRLQRFDRRASHCFASHRIALHRSASDHQTTATKHRDIVGGGGNANDSPIFMGSRVKLVARVKPARAHPFDEVSVKR